MSCWNLLEGEYFITQKDIERAVQYRFLSDGDYITVINETLEKVLVSTTFAQSGLVLVLTSLNFLVSISLGLNISKNFWSQKVSVSTTFVFLILAESLSICYMD